jgi:Zn-dependent oligopeptidase
MFVIVSEPLSKDERLLKLEARLASDDVKWFKVKVEDPETHEIKECMVRYIDDKQFKKQFKLNKKEIKHYLEESRMVRR